jgi:cytidine deaminase
VIMGGNTDVATTAIGQLLPDAFTPSDLRK